VKFGRYKHKDWSEAYQRSAAFMATLVSLKGGPPSALLANQCKLVLRSYYRGPWKMLWALFVDQLSSLWLHYGSNPWEWFRTRILRRPPDEALMIGGRAWNEEDQIHDLMKKL
jgi:hypothetical protein